jgi:hypothetical protein
MGRSCAAVIVERKPILREALDRLVNIRLRIVASIPSLSELDSTALAGYSTVLVVLGSGTQPETILQEIRSIGSGADSITS